jgi:hypothetical protein
MYFNIQNLEIFNILHIQRVFHGSHCFLAVRVHDFNCRFTILKTLIISIYSVHFNLLSVLIYYETERHTSINIHECRPQTRHRIPIVAAST